MSDIIDDIDTGLAEVLMRGDTDAWQIGLRIRDELQALRALARRVHAECGPVKVDLDACFGDTEWTCGWCGVYAIDQSEINHKPDCLWLAAETLLARNGEGKS